MFLNKWNRNYLSSKTLLSITCDSMYVVIPICEGRHVEAYIRVFSI